MAEMEHQSNLFYNRRAVIQLAGSRELAISWAEQNGLLPTRTASTGNGKHDMVLSQIQDHGIGRFRCQKKHSDGRVREVSQTKDTWFEGAHLQPHIILNLCYSFTNNDSYDVAIKKASDVDTFECLGQQTVADWYNFYREIVVEDLLDSQETEGKTGGYGCVVQIDESKFGRSKYNRGRHIEGHWVLGMVETTEKRFRMVVCPENVRDSGTLIPIIEEHVAEGSTIHTDGWRAYNGLHDTGLYVHNVVNQSDPDHRFVA